MDDGPVYIRVLKPGRKKEFEYVQVDKDWAIAQGLEYFVKQISKGKQQVFVHTASYGSKPLFNAKALVDVIHDLTGQCRVALCGSDAGQKIFDAVFGAFTLEEVFSLLSQGRTHEAEEKLSRMYYGLLSTLSGLKFEHDSLDAQASIQSVRAQHAEFAEEAIRQTVADLPGQFYFNWATAAESMVSAHVAAQKILSEIEDREAALQGAMNSAHKTMATALAGPRTNVLREFSAGKSDFILTKSNTGEMYSLLPQVEDAIAQIELDLKAAADFKNLAGMYLQDISALVPQLEQHQRSYRLAEQDFLKYAKDAGVGTKEKPAATPPVAQPGLISEAEYSKAENLLGGTGKHVSTSAQAALNRARACVAEQLSLTTESTALLDSSKELVKIVKRYQDEAQAKAKAQATVIRPGHLSTSFLSTGVSMPGPAIAPAKEQEAKSTPLIVVTERDSVRDDKSAVSLQELADCCVCVGYVVTGRPGCQIATTVKSMLYVLAGLGRIKPQEIKALEEPLTKYLEETDGAIEYLPNHTEVGRRWEASDRTWLRYSLPTGKRHSIRLKLSKAKFKLAQTLFKKLGLTEQEVKRVHTQNKEVAMRRRQEMYGKKIG